MTESESASMVKGDLLEDEFLNGGGTYKQVLDDISLAIAIFDINGYLVYINSMANSVLMAGDNRVTQGVHCSQISDVFWSYVRSVIETGEPRKGVHVRLKNTPLLCNKTPIKRTNVVVGVVSSFQVVTDSPDTIQLLQKNRGLYKEVEAIIESSYDGIYVTDGQANTIMVNSAYEIMTGIKRHEVVGRNMRELVKEGFFNESATLKVLETGKRVTLRQKLRSGKEILVTGNPMFDDQGNIMMVVTNDRDMTELMKLHQRLEHSLQIAMAYKKTLQKMQESNLLGKDFVVVSEAMRAICDLVERVSKTDATVLFCGETGVGKDRLAEEVHKMSPRYNKGVLVKINCGAIPENLLESELFGYECGAFTGARKGGKIGLFELADGGTIFLDEVECLPLSLQPKLLRVLQDLKIIRIGGTIPKKVDVRVVCASNIDLKEMVIKNQFRADLYYRLNVVSVAVPPLRERKEDIPYLVTFFINHFNQKYKKKKYITKETMDLLLSYAWPGNVREVANVIERLSVVTDKMQIDPEDLPHEIRGRNVTPDIDGEMPLKRYLAEQEVSLIRSAIKKFGSARRAAVVLGIDHSTIARKLQRYEKMSAKA
jgi:PAS domain S-box-containing protein